MADHEAGKPAAGQAAATAVPEAWRRTEVARNPERPYPMDFIEALFTDFSEIHGDRSFGDDPAMACGMALFHGRPVFGRQLVRQFRPDRPRRAFLYRRAAARLSREMKIPFGPIFFERFPFHFAGFFQ